MADNLTVFGTDYTGVTGIKATGTGNGTLTYIRPQGTKSISANGTGIDVTEYASVDVAVPAGAGAPKFTVIWYDDYSDIKSITCDKTYSECYALATASPDGANTAIIIDQNDESGTYQIRFSGNVLSVDAYPVERIVYATVSDSPYFDIIYNSDGTIGWNYPSTLLVETGTPTAVKGSVSNHSISVTPSVTNTTNGFIMGGTKTGTAVSVSASELVSGTYTVSSTGTIDVTNYANISVAAQTLPTSVATSSSGTSKATIGRQTSTRYLNIPTGYNATAQYYTISAVADGTAGTPTATKGTVSNHSISVTPSVTNTTGYITGGTKTGTAVSVSASELVSGNLSITENGTGIDVANYSTVSVAVSGGGGSSMNVQVAQSTTRASSSTYTKLISLTCSTAGTYDVYWDCYRSSTSGTSGSQLYIGDSTSGSANTTFTNHVQNNHRTGVQISANQEVSVYARSRGSSYYAYCGQLTIVQTA